jgi:predicted ester cyclase
MSAKEIKALERRWVKELNKGKAAYAAAVDELFANDYVEHGGTGEDTRGAKDYKQSMSEFFSAFPDIHFTLDDMVVEGDKVAVRFTFSGTHKGEFMGIPPTNKKWTMWGIYIDRIAGGKFVESWVRYDTLGLMQQLGLVPTPKKEK